MSINPNLGDFENRACYGYAKRIAPIRDDFGTVPPRCVWIFVTFCVAKFVRFFISGGILRSEDL